MAYWYVQIVRGEYYFTLSENNRIRSVKITAPRGYIFDRNGVALVENEPAYNLQLYRREAKNLSGSEEFAVGVLRLPPEQVHARVERALRYPEFVAVPIAENLGIEEVATIEARAPEHPEFAVAVSQRRLYTRGIVAAHALGYLAEATRRSGQGRARRATRPATGSGRRESRRRTSRSWPASTASAGSSWTRTGARSPSRAASRRSRARTSS